ncbi:MAG: SUMF1/EgtB/PvdO family nonheme iron enzyme, partial [Planctomycetales bacterium]|nr:SUMF1/EgtB/PvdO family nonheme iron enzyme [Planctomycetales bacterium]
MLQQAKSQVEQQLATANKQVDDWKQKADAAERQADNWKQALASAAAIPAGGANATIDPAAAAKRLAEWRERLNAVDANDWRAANEAFIAAGVEYRRLEARRETLRRDYQDSSPTIKAIDAELAAQKGVLADALAKRDEADSRMFQNYERQIALQQREYERLTKTVGMKSTASEPRAVASRIQSLQIEQQPYAEGHTRATQSQPAADVLAMLDQPRFSPLGQLSKPGEIWTSPNGFTMAYVPPDEFMMGSPVGETDRSSDEHHHKVQITKGFVIGTHEVTQGLHQKVMKTNPSQFTSVPGHDTSRFPVEQVSWNDCIAFCNALSKLEGLPPYYEVSGQTVRVLGG